MEYICKDCGKSFGNHKKEYREHRKICEKIPREYKCKYCGQIFTKKGLCINHETYYCKMNPNKKERNKPLKKIEGKKSREGGWTCHCGKIFRTRKDLQEHRKSCDACKINGQIVAKKSYVTKTCPFCGVTKTSTKEMFSKHIKRCKENPSRIPYASHKISEEQKKKQSEIMKSKIEKGTFIVPYVRNHHSKISYPEKYFMEVLKDTPYEYNYQVGRYQLDFAYPDEKIYIEVDGEQHYVDKNIVAHDIERTKILKDKGWKCVKRIRWSKYQRLSMKEKLQFCKELMTQLGSVAHF